MSGRGAEVPDPGSRQEAQPDPSGEGWHMCRETSERGAGFELGAGGQLGPSRAGWPYARDTRRRGVEMQGSGLG
ncbi:hypothetical protein AMTR_s00271p00008670, partial [Amborella trichopoda]